MQLTGDVRRRHDDGVRFFIGIGFGVEVVALQPEVIDFVLKFRGLIGFRKLLSHKIRSFDF